MKTLRNLSVIILTTGIILLVIYITKSYYLFNDLEYREVVNKLIDEEKRRSVEKQLKYQKKIPTKVFKNMFVNPTPWMGYTDDITKDFNKEESKISEEKKKKKLSEIKTSNKKLQQQKNVNNEKISAVKKLIENNKKEVTNIKKKKDLEIAVLKFNQIKLEKVKKESKTDEDLTEIEKDIKKNNLKLKSTKKELKDSLNAYDIVMKGFKKELTNVKSKINKINSKIKSNINKKNLLVTNVSDLF